MLARCLLTIRIRALSGHGLPLPDIRRCAMPPKQKHAKFTLAAAFVVASSVAGCSAASDPEVTYSPSNVMTKPQGFVRVYDSLDKKGLELNVVVSEMADELMKLKVPGQDGGSVIAIASFVSVHDYKTVEPIGRILAEDFIRELHRRGEKVIDHHLTGYVEVGPDGDVMLSRQAEQLMGKMNVSRFLIGSYSRNNEGYVVRARIISLRDRIVESAAVGIVPYAVFPKPPVKKAPPPESIEQSKLRGGLIYRADPALTRSQPRQNSKKQ